MRKTVMNGLTALQRAENPNQQPIYVEGKIYVNPEKMTSEQKANALASVRDQTEGNSKETNADPNTLIKIELLRSRNPYRME
jgi:hypothetical protein